MKTTNFIVIAVLTLAFAAAVSAQKKVTFTSVYSSLGAGCKTMKGGEGQDDAKICPGVGGYQVRVFASAAETNIVAEKKGTDESSPLVIVGLDFDESKTRLEWRLANGKPFAVIIRIPKYDGREDDVPGPGKVVGEELLVSGVGDFEFIYATVNAKTRNANLKARQAADNAYKANL